MKECKHKKDRYGCIVGCKLYFPVISREAIIAEEETSEWRYFRTLNLPFDKAYAEKDGLRFDLEEVNMEETISSAVSQALKQGKKQAVEEILKLQDSVKIDGKISRFVEVSDIKKYLSNNK